MKKIKFHISKYIGELHKKYRRDENYFNQERSQEAEVYELFNNSEYLYI